jgi:hypothetical protein
VPAKCGKCGGTDRYKSRHCKPCHKEYRAAQYARYRAEGRCGNCGKPVKRWANCLKCYLKKAPTVVFTDEEIEKGLL